MAPNEPNAETERSVSRQTGAGVRLDRRYYDLPLEDQRIGQRLGLDRQRVINLRKSARERLNRRTARSTRKIK
jgi:hypothetical protein